MSRLWPKVHLRWFEPGAFHRAQWRIHWKWRVAIIAAGTTLGLLPAAIVICLLSMLGWLGPTAGLLRGAFLLACSIVGLAIFFGVSSYLSRRCVEVRENDIRVIDGIREDEAPFSQMVVASLDSAAIGDKTFAVLRLVRGVGWSEELAISPRVHQEDLMKLLLEKGVAVRMAMNPGNDFILTVFPDSLTSGHFASLGVPNLVTTRKGFDVDLIASDRPAAAKMLAKEVDAREIAFMEQVHSDTIIEVSAGGLAGKGDGLMTDVPGLGLMCVSADCPLVLMADLDGQAVGVCHASWRGTVKQIAFKLARRMTERYGLDPARLVACICPSAGPERYEVGPDVLEAALAGIGPEARQFFHEREGKMFLDLWAANRGQLQAAGLREENVHVAGVCTMTRNDLFPSYRLEGAKAGRFAAVIAAGSRD